MSPEQASGDVVDGRSDLYALGLTAHFAATGQVTMTGDTTQKILVRQLTVPVRRSSPSNSGARAPAAVAAPAAAPRAVAPPAPDAQLFDLEARVAELERWRRGR